ncbi:MAG: hypothetical protein C5B50_14645 [Verrucomicrobia bacterium]|nr:MAG: hypothetical protein C5B50_14645 [Verrucomicrobiota bacterium]
MIHNDKTTGRVIQSSMAEFSRGRLVILRQKGPRDYAQRLAIAERARSLLGTNYDLFSFNCEHAATWAQTGKAESPQLQAAIVLGLLLFGLALASSKG